MTKQDRQTVATLRGVLQALGDIECRGMQNHGLLTACGNTVTALINEIEKRGEGNGDIHAESES